MSSQVCCSGFQALRSTIGLSLCELEEEESESGGIHSCRNATKEKRRICSKESEKEINYHCLSAKNYSRFTFPKESIASNNEVRNGVNSPKSPKSRSSNSSNESFESMKSGLTIKTENDSNGKHGTFLGYSYHCHNIMTETPEIEHLRKSSMKNKFAKGLSLDNNGNNDGLRSIAETPFENNKMDDLKLDFDHLSISCQSEITELTEMSHSTVTPLAMSTTTPLSAYSSYFQVSPQFSSKLANFSLNFVTTMTDNKNKKKKKNENRKEENNKYNDMCDEKMESFGIGLDLASGNNSDLCESSKSNDYHNYLFEMARKDKETWKSIKQCHKNEITCILTSNVLKNENDIIETEKELRKNFNQNDFCAFGECDKMINLKNEMRGVCGFVEKRFHLQSGHIAAIKSSRGSQHHFNCYKQFLKEVFILNEFEYCPFIANLLDCGLDDENNCVIALEYMNLLSLKRILNDKSFGLDIFQLKWISYSILSGLKEMHSKDHLIVHNDIKGDNILLDKWGNVQLTDFGCAQRMINETSPLTKVQGSKQYYAPEKWMFTPIKFTYKSDIWSFGVTMLQCMTKMKNIESKCCYIFNECDSEYINPTMINQCIGHLKNVCEKQMELEMIDLIQEMLITDYNKRGSANKLLCHSILHDAKKVGFGTMGPNEESDLFFMVDSLVNHYSKQKINNFACNNNNIETTSHLWSDKDKIENMSFDTGIAVKKIDYQIKMAVSKLKNSMLYR